MKEYTALVTHLYLTSRERRVSVCAESEGCALTIIGKIIDLSEVIEGLYVTEKGWYKAIPLSTPIRRHTLCDIFQIG